MSGKNYQPPQGREEAHPSARFSTGCPVGNSLDHTNYLLEVIASHYAITGKILSLGQIAEHNIRQRPNTNVNLSAITSER
jgi:hypothetical protein